MFLNFFAHGPFSASKNNHVSSHDRNQELKIYISELIIGRYFYTWFDNKVCELITVKVLHISLLNSTMVAFKVLPLGSYALMPTPSPPFKTILELVLWNGLQSCRCITPDVITVIKMPSFQCFLYFWEQKKSLEARSGE